MHMNLVQLCMGLYIRRGSIVNIMFSSTGRAVAEWRGGRRGSGNRAPSNRLHGCRGVSSLQERTHPMNIASNVTLVRVSLVWLSAVAMALMLVAVQYRPGDGAVNCDRHG